MPLQDLERALFGSPAAEYWNRRELHQPADHAGADRTASGLDAPCRHRRWIRPAGRAGRAHCRDRNRTARDPRAIPSPSALASASAFNSAIILASGFSLSRIAVMSAMVRGGATKSSGRASPRDQLGRRLPFGISTATLARPLAALSAAWMQALTLGVALARHASRLAPPLPCMQACTIGRPTVIRQFSRAASCVRANPGVAAAAKSASDAKPHRMQEFCDNEIP